jgi:hypothetical protein
MKCLEKRNVGSQRRSCRHPEARRRVLGIRRVALLPSIDQFLVQQVPILRFDLAREGKTLASDEPDADLLDLPSGRKEDSNRSEDSRLQDQARSRRNDDESRYWMSCGSRREKI